MFLSTLPLKSGERSGAGSDLQMGWDIPSCSWIQPSQDTVKMVPQVLSLTRVKRFTDDLFEREDQSGEAAQILQAIAGSPLVPAIGNPQANAREPNGGVFQDGGSESPEDAHGEKIREVMNSER